MINVGIEAINVYGGSSYIDVNELAKYRGLDKERFDNLLMKEKTIVYPYEDPVTFGVNAAMPIIQKLSEEDKNKIELLITCTESGIDFGKSISTYIHDYLGLKRNCRLFELKNACYSGTAGYQMAINFILSQASPGAKALVVTTDIARYIALESESGNKPDWSFAEPSSGAGAVAILISDQPKVFKADVGANGYYGYEVMDTCRPIPDAEAGDSDISLLSYLDCCQQTFKEYSRRVKGVDYEKTFQYLAFHTPFGGMVKGAHRTMMRKLVTSNIEAIENDFNKRVHPGLLYCQRVGNIMGGTVFMFLASIIDNESFHTPKRVGMFSYGSGCCSEFYSGVVSSQGADILKQYRIREALDNRYKVSMEEYKEVTKEENVIKFGTRNISVDTQKYPSFKKYPKNHLVLSNINDFHREYRWS